MKISTVYILLITATFFSYLASPCYAQSSSVVSPNENVQPLQKKSNQHAESSERTLKTDQDKQSNRATATAAELSSINELKEVEVKINNLLTEVRKQLANDANKEWFSQNLEKSIHQKAEQACPSIPVLTLMLGNEPFVCTPGMDKQELLYAIEFLNVSINGMLTK